MSDPGFKRKGIGLETVEPAVTPPSEHLDTSFFTKGKVGKSPAKRQIPKGLWTKCPRCAVLIYDKDLDDNLKVCCECDYHFPITAKARIDSLLEPGTFEEIDPRLESVDPLNFKGPAKYTTKLVSNKKKTGLADAVISGLGQMAEHRVALAVMDFHFLGGSMGSVVGEKITRLIERGTKDKLPVIVVSSSGGARMYEGMFSLMQMAKTCGALAYHAEQKLPYISVLTHPTTAGVMASYASVGDLIIAEPGAMIGFAGPRVIKDTTQAKLPPGFQTAEFLQKHGLIDSIVSRHELKGRLDRYLQFMTL